MSEQVNRKVLDLSHHNDVLSWDDIKAAGILGIIHKATEGSSYQDDTYLPRCAQALERGLLWGAYHFANDSDVRSQVDNFLGVVGVDDETLYCLDWEDYGDDTMSLDQARSFVERLDAEIGKDRTVIYGGNTIKEALGDKVDPFWSAHRLWLCQYGDNPVCQESWPYYWLWQYSDGNDGPAPHGCPGVSGDVDTNSWRGTDGALRREWSGADRAPHPPRPRQPIVSIRTFGPVRLLVNGSQIK